MGRIGGLTSLIFLFVAHQYLVGTEGQQICDNTKGILIETMPNIFDITDLSYTLTVEANIQFDKKTLYATEYYDKEFANGRVDTLISGKTSKFLYFNESAEVFTVADYECKTQDLNKDSVVAPYDAFGVYGWDGNNPYQPILGPSNLLRTGFELSQKGQVPKEVDSDVVRGIKTNVWRQCENNGKLKIRYFFIDEKTESGFAVKGKPVPARVTVEGITKEGKNISHTYDFVNYQIFVANIDDTFKIPKMIGCKRLAGDHKLVPSLENKDFHLEAEVVYTPFGNSNFSYVSTISVTMDNLSKHFAYETNTWKSHKDAEMAEPGNDVKYIYDVANEYQYFVDKTYENCFVDDEPFAPQLTLPDGESLSLLASDLFVRDQETVKQYHYLGEDTERGIPVSVFEKTINDDPNDDAEDIIITRYHLADDTLLNTDFSEKNAPIKIVYSNLNILQKFSGIIVFNIYAFTTNVKNKREIFDVSDCFEENDESKWFQISFPMRGKKADDVIPFIPYIQDNFLGMLQGNPIAISPLRIPKIMVDVDMDFIYVTAHLLERPEFLLDFTSQGPYGIKEDSYPIGISTLKKCAKACLDLEDCEYFSYCGAICKLAVEDPTPTQFTDPKCEQFIHEKINTALPTMDQIIDSIRSAIEMGSIELVLPDDKLQFLATGLKDGIAFGKDGLEMRREDDIGGRLQATWNGYKFDEKIANLVKPLGVQSFATCKRACVNNPECESLSFCQATSECSLSSLPEADIGMDHVKEDWQCSILSRVYSDFFERYPGLVLSQTAKKTVAAQTEEACAKACLDEKNFKCLSFDFCPYPNDGNQTCLLHADHFLNFKKDETKIENSLQCGHYSKKMVYDFTVDHSKKVADGNKFSLISDVTTEECAKYCLENPSGCSTFDYCQTGTSSQASRKCRLFNGSGLSKQDTVTCKVYERSDRNSRKAPNAEPSTEGYSKSTVGGVGFFVFLIGLAIGVGGMFAYGYYRANRS